MSLMIILFMVNTDILLIFFVFIEILSKYYTHYNKFNYIIIIKYTCNLTQQLTSIAYQT